MQAVVSVTMRQLDERIGDTMPRFFPFCVIDDEGLALPGARELLAEVTQTGREELAYALEVTDESGGVLPPIPRESVCRNRWDYLTSLYFGEPRPGDISHSWMCIVIVDCYARLA